jgi:hypothetical protein
MLVNYSDDFHPFSLYIPIVFPLKKLTPRHGHRLDKGKMMLQVIILYHYLYSVNLIYPMNIPLKMDTFR